MSLAPLVDTHRIVVCVGSGGVGKTTTSAALSVFAAMQGKRVLSLTIDPAKRLADSLGLSELGHDVQRIPNALFERHGLRCKGSLSAMMLDTKRVFDQLIERHARSERARERILANQIYQYVSTSLAGTQQYMAMEKLFEVREDQHYDLVMLDTPPTRDVLDFLEAPARLTTAIDSPAVRWLVHSLDGRLSLLRKSATVVMRGLSRFTGAGFLTQVASFVRDIDDLFGGFRQRAQRVAQVLRDASVAFVLVTSPHPQNVGEAAFLSRKLRETGIVCRGVVINRVHRSLTQTSAGQGSLAAELRALGMGETPAADIHVATSTDGGLSFGAALALFRWEARRGLLDDDRPRDPR